MLPFVPEGRQNMVAWMTANSDPGEDYGHIQALELPDGANVDGPSVVFSRINQNPQFSQERTLLSQGGSDVLFGDFLVIPVNDSFLYVQPVYVRANQETAVPELKRVVVANGDSVGVGTTLLEALQQSVEGQVDTGGGGEEPPDGGGGNEQTVAQLLREAVEHFDAAQVGPVERRPRDLPDRSSRRRSASSSRRTTSRPRTCRTAMPPTRVRDAQPERVGVSLVLRRPWARRRGGTPGRPPRRRRPSAPSAGGRCSPSSWPASCVN